jgi:hypothetical protein
VGVALTVVLSGLRMIGGQSSIVLSASATQSAKKIVAQPAFS